MLKEYLLILALAILFQVTHAWCEVGHMLTAQVVKVLLEERSLETLQWAESLVDDFNTLTDGRSNTFVEAAPWADDIKEPGTDFFDSWHYTDRPINIDGLLIVLNQNDVNFNSLDALQRAKDVLLNVDTIEHTHTLTKALMIRYILHIIGDMHQPLHNANMFNGTYQSGDVGGNLQKIKHIDGSEINIHYFWDMGAFILQPTTDFITRPLNQTGRHYLEDKAKELIQKYPSDHFSGKDMLNTNIWSHEGYQEALINVYPFFEKTNQVTLEYMQKSYELIEEKIALGGYRMASFLIDIYQQIDASKLKQSYVREKLEFI